MAQTSVSNNYIESEYPPAANERTRFFRVFLMQNHPLMILGTTSFINSQTDLVVSGSAVAPEEALEGLAESPPEAVVVEMSINGPYDFAFLKTLRKTHPSLPVLVYSYHEEIIFARRSLEAGANGYLMKEAHPTRLAEALRKVIAGHLYVSDRVQARMDRERRLKNNDGHLNGALVNSLSNRELQIFQCLGDSFPAARIQRELQLSPKALSNARCRMRKKLGLGCDTELEQFACHWTYYEGDFS